MAVGNIFVFICALAGGSFLPLQLMPLKYKNRSFNSKLLDYRASLYMMSYSTGGATGLLAISQLELTLYSLAGISYC